MGVFVEPEASRMISRFLRVLVGGALATHLSGERRLELRRRQPSLLIGDGDEAHERGKNDEGRGDLLHGCRAEDHQKSV
jgi:hypothetical protein